MERLSWEEAKDYLKKFNKQHGYGLGHNDDKEVTHVIIVFTEDSFDQQFPLESRSYRVANNNKAFIEEMLGYSIYGSSLDGTDQNVRLENYMELEYAGKGGWKVEYCYIED